MFCLLHGKSNLSVCFLGESTSRQSAFWFYLTFRRSNNNCTPCMIWCVCVCAIAIIRLIHTNLRHLKFSRYAILEMSFHKLLLRFTKFFKSYSNRRTLDSPNKQTNDLFFFIFYSSQQKNKMVRSFFGRIFGAQFCLRFYLTFNIRLIKI